MTCLFKSLSCCALGIALACFGVVHSVSSFPGPEPFDRLAADLPQLRAVFSFSLGVLAALAGVVLLVLAIRRMRACRQQPPMRPGQGAALQPGDGHGYAAEEGYGFEEVYGPEGAYDPAVRGYGPHGEGRAYLDGRRPLRRIPVGSQPR